MITRIYVVPYSLYTTKYHVHTLVLSEPYDLFLLVVGAASILHCVFRKLQPAGLQYTWMSRNVWHALIFWVWQDKNVSRIYEGGQNFIIERHFWDQCISVKTYEFCPKHLQRILIHQGELWVFVVKSTFFTTFVDVILYVISGPWYNVKPSLGS